MFGPSLARCLRQSVRSWVAAVAKGAVITVVVVAGPKSLAGACQGWRCWVRLAGADYLAGVAATFEWRILLLILMVHRPQCAISFDW